MLVSAVLLALLIPLVAGCDREVEVPPPSASKDSSGERADQARKTLAQLSERLRSGDRDDVVALATPEARELLGQVDDNAAALRISDVSMRYVDEGAPLTAEELAELGEDAEGAWRATVELEYRYGGFDKTPARMETSVVLAPTSDGARIVSFGDAGSRTPLWLADRLSVVRTGDTLVAAAGDSAGRYARLLPPAVRQVRRVLPDWRGPLIVEVPRSASQLDAALKAEPGQYDNIAAVTTTVDGSLASDAPVRVFVNPTVFGKLKERGAQVVMSHEATHVATGATFTTMPTWLQEGFADFVALDDAGVPVDLAARQILDRIRKEGLPRTLPTSEDLDPTANGLGATYEEAWLACRFMAQKYGADRLVRFYRSVAAGASTQEAFRSELGTTQRMFVAQWRRDLARLARVAR